MYGFFREESIKLILDTTLSDKKVESSIVGGIRVLINLLGQKESKSTESSETYGTPFNNVVEDEQRDKFAFIILPYLDKLNRLLIDPPEVSFSNLASLMQMIILINIFRNHRSKLRLGSWKNHLVIHAYTF